MVYIIEEINNISVHIAELCGVISLSLFASYARDESTSNRYIDLFYL